MGASKEETHWGMDYIGATRVHDRNASDILVGVLDGGMDVTNPVFNGNIWCRQKTAAETIRKSIRTVDVDRSCYGIDFTNPPSSQPNLIPDNIELCHATQVASIIGGQPLAGNFEGGVAHALKMMPLKIQPTHLDFDIEPVIKAVEFAIKQGVHILNCSFIYYGQDPRLEAVFKKAIEKGVLVVAAAGNDDANLENHPGLPSNLDSPSVLTVGAIQSGVIDHLSGGSNFGSLVDIAAPGGGGLYVGPHKRVQHPPGKTSFASAYVSGAAALVWSQALEKGLNRLEQAKRVKELILNAARPVLPSKETGEFDPQVKTWGMGNPVLDLSFLDSNY